MPYVRQGTNAYLVYAVTTLAAHSQLVIWVTRPHTCLKWWNQGHSDEINKEMLISLHFSSLHKLNIELQKYVTLNPHYCNVHALVCHLEMNQIRRIYI